MEVQVKINSDNHRFLLVKYKMSLSDCETIAGYL